MSVTHGMALYLFQHSINVTVNMVVLFRHLGHRLLGALDRSSISYPDVSRSCTLIIVRMHILTYDSLKVSDAGDSKVSKPAVH